MEGGNQVRVYRHIIQQDEKWFRIRKGRPTASNAKKILTPTGKDSASWEEYAIELIAEGIYPNEPEAWTGNKDTDRGNTFEDEAIRRFEQVMNLQTVKVGFVTRDDGIVGLSPDAFVLKPGVDIDRDAVIDPTDCAIINGHDLFLAGLEAKVPRAKGQVSNLVKGGVPSEYIPQVEFSMAATGLPWYFCSVSECDKLREHIVLQKHSDYTAKMKDAVDRFLIYYSATRTKVIPQVKA